MATTSPAESANRPAFASATLVVLVLGALLDFAHIGAYLSGADIPAEILALKIILGAAGLAAAAALWGRQRWGVLLALVVAVPNLLLNAWGFADALAMSGTTAEKVVTGLGVLLSLAVIGLVTPLVTRRAPA